MARHDASEKSELLQGTLDMLILKVVGGEPLHGYAIAQRIEQTSRALLQVPPGSLYPASPPPGESRVAVCHVDPHRRWPRREGISRDGKGPPRARARGCGLAAGLAGIALILQTVE
jgi:hypothetical protein